MADGSKALKSGTHSIWAKTMVLTNCPNHYSDIDFFVVENFQNTWQKFDD